jgi:type II secretory pathway pseudopilin PulG
MKRNRGFTIVELTIIVIILGILTTLIIVAFNKIQMQARDSKRVADVRAMANQIQKYYDQNGEYPPASDAAIVALSQSGLNDPTDISGWNYLRNMTTSYCNYYPRWGGGSGSSGPSCRNYGYLSDANGTGISESGIKGPGCNIAGNANGKPYYFISWYDETSGTIKFSGSNIVITTVASSQAFPGEVCQITYL